MGKKWKKYRIDRTQMSVRKNGQLINFDTVCASLFIRLTYIRTPTHDLLIYIEPINYILLHFKRFP